MNKFCLLALGTALAFTACQKSTEPTINPKKHNVSFHSSMAAYSRASETEFDNGDQIGVFAAEAGASYADNVVYSYNDGIFESASPIKIGSKALAYNAIYPYSADAAQSGSFEVAADQNAAGALTASDFMVASLEESKDSSPELSFQHKLSLVEINISSSEEDLSQSEFVVMAQSAIDYDIAADSYTASGEVQEITPAAFDDVTFKAIVAPQSVDGEFIKFTHNEKEYVWSVDAATEFKPGYKYICTVSVDSPDVQFSPVIEPWVSQDLAGSVAESSSTEEPDASDEPFSAEFVSLTNSGDDAYAVIDVNKGDFSGNYFVVSTTYDYYYEAFSAPLDFVNSKLNTYLSYQGGNPNVVDNKYIYGTDGEITVKLAYWSNIRCVTCVCGLNSDGSIATDILFLDTDSLNEPDAGTETGSLAIAVNSTSANGANIDISIEGSVDAYYVHFVTMADLMSVYNASYEECAEYAIEVEGYKGSTLTPAANINIFDAPLTSFDTTSIKALSAGTTYVVMAFAINSSGQILSEIASQKFTTTSSTSTGGGDGGDGGEEF